MLTLALAALTPLGFLSLESYVSLEKSPGKKILKSLFLTLAFGVAVHVLSGTADILTWLGVPITVENYGAMLTCSSLIFVLYIGPLVQTAFIEDEGPEFNLPELQLYMSDPLCEEIWFRVCLINCLLETGFGFNGSLMVSMITFGFLKNKQIFSSFYFENALKHQKIRETLIEISFTLALGGLLGFMYLRTGSLLACVLVNIFESVMGFPDLSFNYKNHQLYKYR